MTTIRLFLIVLIVPLLNLFSGAGDRPLGHQISDIQPLTNGANDHWRTNSLLDSVEPQLSDDCAKDPCGEGLDGTIVYCIVETMPEFPGGESARIRFLQNNLVYPRCALESGIRGPVYVTFIIDTSGHVTDVGIMRGLCNAIDNECLRVTASMPDWSPGYQCGKKVRVRFCMMIRFDFYDDDIDTCRHTSKTDVNQVDVEAVGDPAAENTGANGNNKETIMNTGELLADDVSFSIYPNPASEYFIIKTNDIRENMKYMIFDMAGDPVKQGILNSNVERISSSDLKSGSYIVKLYSETGPVSDLKLVISK